MSETSLNSFALTKYSITGHCTYAFRYGMASMVAAIRANLSNCEYCHGVFRKSSARFLKYRYPAVSPSKLSRHERKCGRYPHFQGVRSSL